MQHPPPATFVENYETDEPILELARFMEAESGGTPGEQDSLLYNECASLLQTDPSTLFMKMSSFMRSNMEAEDSDLEGGFHCLFLLLRYLPGEVALGAAESCLSILTSSASRSVLRLKVMANLYSLMDFMPRARYLAFLAMVKYASANRQTKVLSSHFEHLDKWVEEWGCNPDQVIELYWEAVQALLTAGEEAAATSLLHDMLRAAGAASDATVVKVAAQAKLACLTAIKDAKTFKFDHLLDLRAVAALEQSDPDVFQLLRIFVGGQLSDFTLFASTKSGLIKALQLDYAACELKMKLLTLASLASSADEVSYETIASQLGISVAVSKDANMPAWMGEVEAWVIRAIASGLIEARLDQRRGIMEVSRSTQREFNDNDWACVGQKLLAWRNHAQRMLMVVEKAA